MSSCLYEAGAQALKILVPIERPQLTDIRLDWGSPDVVETYPARIPDLWLCEPVVVSGRHLKPARAPSRSTAGPKANPSFW
ncbi:MAG: hypothetical protein HYU36_05645 [Planctomycetes bacterium]|nr:hypothetical protein [Planctomycetota bacterium]